MPKTSLIHIQKRVKIYKSRWHVFLVSLLVIVPFLFLLFFARISHIETSKLFYDIFISIGRLLVAYIISVILGWTFAVSFYHGRRANVALPVFDVLQSFPTYAGLPLATLYWGPSSFTVIFFLVLAIIWPIFFSITSSLKLIRHDWQEAVEISRLRGFKYLLYFLFPISIPGLVTGSVIGLGDGWEALVATEIIVGLKAGLGSFFQFFSSNPNVTALGIFGLLLIIFSINKLIWLPLLDWSHRQMEE